MRWYTGNLIFDTVLIVAFVFALLIFLMSQFGTAKYGGRFGERHQGFKLGSRAGWMLMECPTLIIFPIIYWSGVHALNTVSLFFFVLWMFHYINRTLVTPLLMRVQPGSSNSFDINVVLFGWITLCMHCYLNAYYISELHIYHISWFTEPVFITGLLIYIFGFSLNVYSDSILRNLRSKVPHPDEPRYKIPYGGCFKWVSCPQYLGEIFSFIGIAVMTWNLGAVFVLVITIANLVPRAITTHRWFNKNFTDYPKERKAIFPYVL